MAPVTGNVPGVSFSVFFVVIGIVVAIFSKGGIDADEAAFPEDGGVEAVAATSCGAESPTCTPATNAFATALSLKDSMDGSTALLALALSVEAPAVARAAAAASAAAAIVCSSLPSTTPWTGVSLVVKTPWRSSCPVGASIALSMTSSLGVTVVSVTDRSSELETPVVGSACGVASPAASTVALSTLPAAVAMAVPAAVTVVKGTASASRTPLFSTLASALSPLITMVVGRSGSSSNTSSGKFAADSGCTTTVCPEEGETSGGVSLLPGTRGSLLCAAEGSAMETGRPASMCATVAEVAAVKDVSPSPPEKEEELIVPPDGRLDLRKDVRARVVSL